MLELSLARWELVMSTMILYYLGFPSSEQHRTLSLYGWRMKIALWTGQVVRRVGGEMR